MILAEATAGGASANEIGIWIVCLFAIVAGTKACFDLVDRFRGKQQQISPQPLDVRMVSEFVKKEECAARHAASAQIAAGIREEVTVLRAERKQDVDIAARSRKALYEKIDEAKAEMSQRIESVRNDVTEMEHRMNSAGEARMDKVHERINDVLEAVSELRGEVRKRPQ